jgi:tartrate dehydratase beta subunit/fumarate hydratase class I family protein
MFIKYLLSFVISKSIYVLLTHDHIIGGFYLGSIGGPAAILAQNCIKKVEVLEYPELGS